MVTDIAGQGGRRPHYCLAGTKGPAPYSAVLEPLHQEGGVLTAWQGWKSRLPNQHWLAWVIVKLGAGGRGSQFLFCSSECSSYFLKCLSRQAAPFLLWPEEAGSGLFLCVRWRFQFAVFFISRSGTRGKKKTQETPLCHSLGPKSPS